MTEKGGLAGPTFTRENGAVEVTTPGGSVPTEESGSGNGKVGGGGWVVGLVGVVGLVVWG